MKASRWRVRSRVLLGATTTAAVAALIGIGVPAVALSSNTGTSASINAPGGGYPPPGGIYKGFTNCPVKNPLMSQSNSFTACTLRLPGKDLPCRNQFTLECGVGHILDGNTVA